MPDDEHESTAGDERAEDGAERSARPYWSGTLSFGLVSVPVDLYPVVRSGSAGVGMRMLSAEGHPLQRRYFCPDEETDLSGEQLVRGFELDDGEYVVVTDEELEALEPKKSRDIDLRLFVPEDELDPVYFDRPFVLASGAESPKAYRLLAAVMERERRAGIATFVMRDKEYLIAILSRGGLLRAESLRFADELRSAEGLGADGKAPPADMVEAFARAIAKRTEKKLDLELLDDPERAALRKLIAEKHRKGRDVLRAPEEAMGAAAAANAEVIDLMEVLRRSLPGSKTAPEAEPKPKRAEPKKGKAKATSKAQTARAARPRKRHSGAA